MELYSWLITVDCVVVFEIQTILIIKFISQIFILYYNCPILIKFKRFHSEFFTELKYPIEVSSIATTYMIDLFFHFSLGAHIDNLF